MVAAPWSKLVGIVFTYNVHIQALMVGHKVLAQQATVTNTMT
jgi:hypothetical protein